MYRSSGPAGQPLDHFFGGLDVVTRRQIHVDEELVAVAVAEHLAYELRAQVTAADEHHEGGEEHNVPQLQNPFEQRAVRYIDSAGVGVA